MPKAAPQPPAAPAVQADDVRAPAGILYGVHTVTHSSLSVQFHLMHNLLLSPVHVKDKGSRWQVLSTCFIPVTLQCYPLSSALRAGGTTEQSLELVRSLAAMAGSSGLILEVLGGVCTRWAHGAEALQGNAIACFQAALQGVSKVH